MTETKSTTSLRDQVYQCQVCSARLLRSLPVDPRETCPRCGQQGQWRSLFPIAKPESAWLKDLFERIEGQNGPVQWQ